MLLVIVVINADFIYPASSLLQFSYGAVSLRCLSLRPPAFHNARLFATLYEGIADVCYVLSMTVQRMANNSKVVSLTPYVIGIKNIHSSL